MARPIWTGTLAFGLLHVPVSLMAGERRVDLHFRMLDARDNSPIRYERVNAESGEEVPWKEIVKAYEYEKGSYVVLEKEDIQSAAPETHQSIDVEAFVAAADIDPRYFEKPYVLMPGKKAEKGYVLLRDTLAESNRIGIARIVVRTREHLCAVIPHQHALVLMMLRYPQELVQIDDYALPEGKPATYRITPKEQQMAKQLIDSMSDAWNPKAYRDEFRERLGKVIEKRLKSKGKVPKREITEAAGADDAATNVVDFMSLLQQSLDSNKRTPAKGATKGASTGKAAPVKKLAAARTPPARKAAAKKAAKKSVASAKPARKRA